MSSAAELDPSYILHSRKYRDTSVILELLGLNGGRHAVVVRGARSPKSKMRGQLQPFTPLLIASVGRGELQTSTSIDIARRGYALGGDRLMLGLYVNELLYRLLGKFDPVPGLFSAYEQLLQVLEVESSLLTVRQFELLMLQELGYGVNFFSDAMTGEAIDASRTYHFVADEGFKARRGDEPGAIPGQQIINIATENWPDVDELVLRQITRRAIHPLLGGRPLKSRALFQDRPGLPAHPEPPGAGMKT